MFALRCIRYTRSRLAVAALFALAARGSAQPSPPRIIPPPAPLRDGPDDFDFLHGIWRSSHGRLRRPLSGSNPLTSTDGFNGRMVARPLADSAALIQEYELVMRDSTRIRGVSLMSMSRR